MSLEPGGRADKYGNVYECFFLASLMLRLIMGNLRSITVESLDTNKDSAEYIAVDNKGISYYYQCKLSNALNDKWRICDLKNHDVFNRARNIIESSPNNRYVFVSALGYGELSELCKRARTNSSLQQFKDFQLTNDKIRTTWKDCAVQLGLDLSSETDTEKLLMILSKCDFETVPYGPESRRELSSRVQLLFMGDGDGAREELEHYINSNHRFGSPITADEIISVMAKRGYPFRKHMFGEGNVPLINGLNETFINSFRPINGTVIHRTETDKIMEEISKGNSVILHGRAGYGKSGCVYELVNKLKENNTLFLALKLDQIVPKISSDSYGKDLGLSQSPVHCLHNISARKNCVLILDQLDALRWTSHHSASALAVCKTLISEAKYLNEKDGGRISLVFITRTFDLENDAGLKNLFTENENAPSWWSKIEIGALSRSDVIGVIGDEYNRLTLKLQKLLLTPSSLYIWTTLADDSSARDITTPFELMVKWWYQIQTNCQNSGINKADITALRDQIVTAIEHRPNSRIPKQRFVDSQKELQALISNGLLIENDSSVSFSHQSFLDHFAVENMINKIYDELNVVDVIGHLDEQTPYVRYRLLRVLQTLIVDEDYFIKVSSDILGSDKVRHYFKCAVFEVIGQCEHPYDALLDFAHCYFINSDWHSYVCRTVYHGHQPYIESLDKYGRYDWSSKEGLELLYSINSQAQNFIIEKIKPLCFQTKELDKDIYFVLGQNCQNDSHSFLELRLEMLKKHPDFWSMVWNLLDLSSQSPNMIPVIKLIINDIDLIHDNLYFGKEDSITTYSKLYYHEIIDELLPVICEKTMQFNPRWPNDEYNEKYSHWVKSGYNSHIARNIVELAKAGLCEFAVKEPEAFMSFAEKFDGRKSVVYYEILAEAVYNLSTDYSDFAVSWLFSNPKEREDHIFIYTKNAKNYLSLTKKTIEKFSPFCTENNFKSLEKMILHWSDPHERMMEIYNSRLTINSTKQNEPVYYSYWGHLQKELLPCLDEARTSKETKQLIGVLNRNKWIRVPFYNQGWSVSVTDVVSPVHSKAGKLSDKTWLKIISVPNSRMRNDVPRKSENEYSIETSHNAFSNSFSEQAKHDPERFARLSLKFPQECFSKYITSAIHALYEHDVNVPGVDFSLTLEVVKHFLSHSDSKVTMEILRLIEKRAIEDWPDEILTFVCDSAINSPHPSPDFSVYAKNVEKTPHSLFINSMNSVRGRAIGAISQLLWNHNNLAERFKPVIESAVNDPNEAVRFFSLTGAYPYCNLDRDFCIKILKKLIQNEPCILGHPDIWEIICLDYPNNSEFYVGHLIKACCSGIDELDATAAGYLCALSVYYDFKIAEQLYRIPLNAKQIERVCLQAVFSFNNDKFNQRSKAILMHYLDEEHFGSLAFNKLFLDKSIDIDRDEELLNKIICSKPKEQMVNRFLKYINEQKCDISKYANTLQTLCEELSAAKDRYDRYSTMNDLVKCIIKLLDNNKQKLTIKAQCLNMLDNIYKSCYNMSFSQIFDNMD